MAVSFGGAGGGGGGLPGAPRSATVHNVTDIHHPHGPPFSKLFSCNCHAHLHVSNVIIHSPEYRIAGNFRGLPIFVIFVTEQAVTKFVSTKICESRFRSLGEKSPRLRAQVCTRSQSNAWLYIRHVYLNDSVFDYQTQD